MSDEYGLLLAEARRFYEEHEDGRQDPFNAFSVLRSESDEVNLHFRFLHALLDYQKPGEQNRDNLTDFLQHVGVKEFKLSNVKVERERYNIDILITNGVGQAVWIENKIEARDQREQLLRYDETLKEHGYCERHLLYLTLDGHRPCEGSVGDLQCQPISYMENLPPWLHRCQKRACDEPGLRESVAQYLQLVQKLTGKDFEDDVNLKNPARDHIELLSNDVEMKKHAKRIATRLKPFWEAIKAAGLHLRLPTQKM